MINIEKRHLKIVRKILAQAKSTKFFAFGSRVTKKSKRFSDLDICYKGRLSKKLLINIKSNFYESNLPFKIDIVAYKQLPKGFLSQINEEMIEI